MTLIFKLLAVLPLWLLQAAGSLLGWAAYLGSGVYRRRLQDHAQLAGVPGDAVRRSVSEAGKMVAELPRLWQGRPVPVFWEGQEHIERALEQGQGLLFLTPHLGCFEVTAQAYAARFGTRGRPMTVLYRPPRQMWLRRLVEQSRQRPGLETAPTSLAGVKQLLKALKKGQSVGLLPDQVPPAGQGLWLPFFGRDAYTMTLSARLALQTGAVVLLAWGERLAWGRGYRVHVLPLQEPLPQDLELATRSLNQAMESLVLRQPSQYLWGYARYKKPREHSAAAREH